MSDDDILATLEAERDRYERLALDALNGWERLKAELAALRFSEREWRDKAQDKIAECDALEADLAAWKRISYRLRKANEKLRGAASLLAGWQKPPTDSPEAGEAFMIMVRQARERIAEAAALTEDR